MASAAKLHGSRQAWRPEQACLREAADALVLCADVVSDPSARDVLAEAMVLADDLVAARPLDAGAD
jgi:hypothetical protein